MAFFNPIHKLTKKVKYGACKILKKAIRQVDAEIVLAVDDKAVETFDYVKAIEYSEAATIREPAAMVHLELPVLEVASKSTFILGFGDFSVKIARKVRKSPPPTTKAPARPAPPDDPIEFIPSTWSEPICFAPPRWGYVMDTWTALARHRTVTELYDLRGAGFVSDYRHSAVLDNLMLCRARSMARNYSGKGPKTVKGLVSFYEGLERHGAIAGYLPKARIPVH